ncbi:MAG: hypothetical protein QOD83_1302 [Solirubrobacteraceae bacterium]|jgi:uncharacterized protein YbcI|nr:hypothetical protein [Solirubrobacteraceae bacterium]MEA2231486.1 hypothetical protein [Solirubrobacteraceae bacterium]
MSDERTTEGLGAALADISTELVGLHKRSYGKGPIRAKSFLIDNMVVCLLEGGFTIVERTLIDVGRDAIVKELRLEFQAAMRDKFTAVVETNLRRKVICYMSQISTDPAIAVEMFLLEPAGMKIVVDIDMEFLDDQAE